MKGKSISPSEASEKINNKFPQWKYEITNFTNGTSLLSIKCDFCQKESTYKNLYALLYKKFPCECLSSASQCKSIKIQEQVLEKLKSFENMEFISWERANDDKNRPAVKILCNICNNTFIKRTNIFLKDQKCPYCDFHSKRNTFNRSRMLEERGYELLDEYVNGITPVRIKHLKCGFIWTTKMNYIKKFDGTCPQCNRFMSKGEQRILSFLRDNNIDYEKEKSFSWQSHQRVRYDFWIPEWNLIIEYNGRQHYEETNFFHCTLQENIVRDQMKMEEAIENGLNYLVIPDTLYDNLEIILGDWFNDYSNKEVRGKLMAFERNSSLKN